ncbi:MAG: cell division protein ZapA [Pseudomonadota bacterium]|nr:cell division protein ZapA [Pseudomonadota bacterium]
MPDLKVTIGGRNFSVACDPGEEGDVQESAKLLDYEAELIQSKLGRLPEDKMLLLSALLLGDKFRSLNSKFKGSETTTSKEKVAFNKPQSVFDETQTTEELDEDRVFASFERISTMLDKIADLQVKKGGVGSKGDESNEGNDEDSPQKSFI